MERLIKQLLVWEYYYTDGGFITRAMKYGLDYFSNSVIGDINQDYFLDLFAWSRQAGRLWLNRFD